MIPFGGLVASGNCWQEGQCVRWTKVDFKVLHAAPVQGSHGAFWLAKSSVVVHSGFYDEEWGLQSKEDRLEAADAVEVYEVKFSPNGAVRSKKKLSCLV